MGPDRDPLFFIGFNGRRHGDNPYRALRDPVPRVSTRRGSSSRAGRRGASPTSSAPALRDLGFRLVRVKLSAAASPILQIMAERPDGAMGVEDCEAASIAISPHLDLEDPIQRALSAGNVVAGHRPAAGARIRFPPGDRPRGAGRTGHPLEGRKRFRGLDRRGRGGRRRGYVAICASVDDAEAEEIVARLAVADMAEARLVLTEALIRDALRREKTGIKTRKQEVRREKAEGRKTEHQRKQRQGSPRTRAQGVSARNFEEINYGR